MVSVNNTNPFVIVWMVTYNHEKFIEQAIESVLAQKTNFSYKLYIGEDFSTDNTRALCQKLKNTNPEKIELFLNKKNIGATANGVQMYQKCFESNAKYIALLEGDDYWTDPNKLQKQVDFLEKNEEYVICGGIAKELHQDTGFLNQTTIINKNKIYSVQDYIYSNYAATCTLLFNSSYLNPMPEWFNNLSFGDWGLVLTILYRSKKKIIVLSDEMGVYRIHSFGVHSRLATNKKYLYKALLMHIDFIDFISKKLFRDNEFSVEVKSKKIRVYKEVSILSKENNYLNYLFYYMKHIWYRGLLRISKINL